MIVPDPEEIAQQREMLKVYRRTLAHLLTQAAQHGGLSYAPPVTANGINEARDNIRHVKNVLRGWGEAVEEHPDDEPTQLGNSSAPTPSVTHKAERSALRPSDGSPATTIPTLSVHPRNEYHSSPVGKDSSINIPDRVFVRPGVFKIGVPDEFSESYRIHAANEQNVGLSAFEIARYPITVREYARFLLDAADIPVNFEAALGAPSNWSLQRKHPNRPVTGVSWTDAVLYCYWLAGQTGFPMRLPTDAEWEYAVRGNTPGKIFAWRQISELMDLGVPWSEVKEYANIGNYLDHPVAIDHSENPPDCLWATPSHCGCYYLVGNVWEYCSTSWSEDESHTRKRISTQDMPPSDIRESLEKQNWRIIRGGSYKTEVSLALVWAKRKWPQGNTDRLGKPLFLGDKGFRVAIGQSKFWAQACRDTALATLYIKD